MVNITMSCPHGLGVVHRLTLHRFEKDVFELIWEITRPFGLVIDDNEFYELLWFNPKETEHYFDHLFFDEYQYIQIREGRLAFNICMVRDSFSMIHIAGNLKFPKGVISEFEIKSAILELFEFLCGFYKRLAYKKNLIGKYKPIYENWRW